MSNSRRAKRDGRHEKAVQRLRVPHGNGEIELLVQIVPEARGVEVTEVGVLGNTGSWDAAQETTNIRPMPEMGPTQTVAKPLPLPQPQAAPQAHPHMAHVAQGQPQTQIAPRRPSSHGTRPPAPAVRPPSQDSAAPGTQNRGFVLAPGARAGKYELKEKLGQGTFGYVFTARDLDLDRDVAFKVLNPTHQTNSDIVARFLQEARASARIKHPGIVTVLDCGRIPTSVGETAFITMELLEGESLTNRLIRTGRLAADTAVEICRQIASALDAAHRADVLHRDLKPDNIYLVPDPAVPTGERVKVLDFGLAKIGGGGHTMMNTVFGTPRYMSPEQCRSATQIDHRSDIYSLGCILFELVTGRTPFDGDLRQLLERHQRAVPPRARSFAPEITPQLDNLIDLMLAKDPSARPQTMAAVQGALSGAGAIMPGVAATMPPRPASVIALAPLPQGADSGVYLVPPSGPRELPDVHALQALLPPRPPPLPVEDTVGVGHKRRRAPLAAAAIAAFVVAAALTAIATRGRTKTAAASPAPPVPTLPVPAPAP